jgi:hypothetical protein
VWRITDLRSEQIRCPEIISQSLPKD